MATRTWLSAGSTDMNLATNYSGTGALLVTDDLVFDATSVVNVIATSSLSVNTITANIGYTGTFDQNQQAITCAGVVYLDSTGNVVVDGGLITVGGNFEITSGVTSLNQNGMELEFTASGNLIISKGGSLINAIKHIQINSGITVNTTSLYLRNDNGTSITLADNTSTLSISNNITIYSVGTCKPIEDNGGSIYYTTGYSLTFKTDGSTASDITLPKIGVGNLNMIIATANSSLCTFRQGGDINIKSLLIDNRSNEQVEFKSAGYNIDLSTLTLDNKWVSNTSTIDFDFASGTHNMYNVNFETDLNSITNLDFGSSNLNLSGNNSMDLSNITGNRTISFGTSNIIFDGTGLQNINLDDETAYNIEVNNNGGGLTLQDAMSCNTFTNIDGDFDTNGFDLTTVGNCAFNSSDIIIIDSTYTMTGDGAFTVAVTLASLSTNSGTYIFQGDCSIENNYAIYQDFNVVKGGADGKTFTLNSTFSSTVATFNQIEILHANGIFKFNKKVLIYGATPFANNTGTLQTTWSINILPSTLDTMTLNLPSVHTGVSIYIQQTNAGTLTVNLVDDFNGKLFSVVTSGTSTNWIFNTNNNDITTTSSLYFTVANTGSTGILNSGTSNFSIGGLVQLRSTQTGTVFNLGSGTWSFSTTFEINVVGGGIINADTSTILANGTGAQTLTSDGYTLYDIEVNNNGGGLTLLDALSCNTLDDIQGDFNQAGFSITTVSDCYFRDGLLTLDGLYTMTGIGTFAIEDTVSSISASTSTLVFEDTTSLFLKENIFIGTIKAGSNTKTVTKQEYNTIYLSQLEFLGTGTINWQGTLVFRGLIPFINNIGQFNNINYNTIINASDFGDVTLNSNNNINTLLEITSSHDVIINQTGPFDLRRFKLRTSIARDIIYNTNDNAITINKVNSDFFIDNQISDSTIVFNAGSSIITTDIFAIKASQSVTMNMSTSVSNIGTNLVIYTDTYLIYNYGSSILNFNGTVDQIITALDITLGVLKVDKPSGKLSILGNSHWVRYNLQSGIIVEFDNTGTHILDTYIIGDMDGAKLRSTLFGSQWTFVNPINMTVSGVEVQDSIATNEILADVTSIDNGDNINWTFESLSPDLPIIEIDGLQYKIVKQTGSYGNWLMIAVSENDEVVVLKTNKNNEFVACCIN